MWFGTKDPRLPTNGGTLVDEPLVQDSDDLWSADDVNLLQSLKLLDLRNEGNLLDEVEAVEATNVDILTEPKLVDIVQEPAVESSLVQSAVVNQVQEILLVEILVVVVVVVLAVLVVVFIVLVVVLIVLVVVVVVLLVLVVVVIVVLLVLIVLVVVVVLIVLVVIIVFIPILSLVVAGGGVILALLWLLLLRLFLLRLALFGLLLLGRLLGFLLCAAEKNSGWWRKIADIFFFIAVTNDVGDRSITGLNSGLHVCRLQLRPRSVLAWNGSSRHQADGEKEYGKRLHCDFLCKEQRC